MTFGYEMCEYFKNALNIFGGPVYMLEEEENERNGVSV